METDTDSLISIPCKTCVFIKHHWYFWCPFLCEQPFAWRRQWALTPGTPAWIASSRPPSGRPAPGPAAWACPPGWPIRTAGVRCWSRAGCAWSNPAKASSPRASSRRLHPRYRHSLILFVLICYESWFNVSIIVMDNAVNTGVSLQQRTEISCFSQQAINKIQRQVKIYNSTKRLTV